MLNDCFSDFSLLCFPDKIKLRIFHQNHSHDLRIVKLNNCIQKHYDNEKTID